MSCVHVADVLQLVIDHLDKGPLPKQYLVVKVHQWVLHVLLDFCDEMNVVNEEHFEEVVADVSPVSEDFSEAVNYRKSSFGKHGKT